jgi:hypothetical protein
MKLRQGFRAVAGRLWRFGWRVGANLLGPELLASGVIGIVGATATPATYNTGTGAGTAARVSATDQSYVTWTGLAAGTYRITVQTTATAGGGQTTVRNGNQVGTVIGNVPNGTTTTYTAVVSGGQVTLTASGNGSSVGFTVQSFRQVL